KMSVANKKHIDFFGLTVGLILLITAISKSATLMLGPHLLDVKDFLLGLSYRELFYVIIPLEFFIVGLVFFGHSPFAKYLVVSWFASLLLIYRFLSALFHPPKPCTCLGSLVDWLGANPRTVENL